MRTTVRRLAPTLALLLALAAPSRADPRRLEADDLELLPLSGLDWIAVAERDPELVHDLQEIGRRHGEIERDRAALPADARLARAALALRTAALAVRLRGALDRLAPRLEEVGVPPDVLAALDGAPRGPGRVERQAVRLVLLAPGVDPDARARLAVLVPAVDATLLATAARRAAAADAPDEAARLDARAADVERRFWRVADTLLEEEARRWVRRRLPTRLQEVPDLFGHLAVLEGLTAAQWTQLKALFTRLEGDAALEQAARARADVLLADPDTPEEARAEARRRRDEADLRLHALARDAWTRGQALLTPAQRDALRALPPHLAAGDRPGDVRDVVRAVPLDASQVAAVDRLQAERGGFVGRLLQDLLGAWMRARGAGPGSPAEERAAYERGVAFGRALRAARPVARAIFLEVLRPEQVTAWVLGVPRPRRTAEGA